MSLSASTGNAECEHGIPSLVRPHTPLSPDASSHVQHPAPLSNRLPVRTTPLPANSLQMVLRRFSNGTAAHGGTHFWTGPRPPRNRETAALVAPSKFRGTFWPAGCLVFNGNVLSHRCRFTRRVHPEAQQVRPRARLSALGLLLAALTGRGAVHRPGRIQPWMCPPRALLRSLPGSRAALRP